MRIYTTSAGLDPAALVPGEDLVLALDERHGLDAPHGVVAHDHLDMSARHAVDEAAVSAMRAWHAARDAHLTVDGICLPFVWEHDIYTHGFIVSIRDAVAVDRALEAYGTRSVELTDADPHTERAVRAAAERRGVEVTRAADPQRAAVAAPAPGEFVVQTTLRRRVLARLLSIGIPSRLRRDCFLFLSYWPQMPLLDRVLDTPGIRAAIFAGKRPAGVRRSLRAAVQGGWVGTPGPRTRRRAARSAAAALTRAAEPPRIDVMGLELGAALHARALDLARKRGAGDLADAAVLRRAFAGGHVRTMVLPYDIEPHSRLVGVLAREAGTHTFLLQHGAILLPRPLKDGEVAAEVAVWAHTVAGPGSREDGAHAVGFPVPHERPPTRALAPSNERPTVVVLGQHEDPYTVTIDARLLMRHYCIAMRAVLDRFPGARVVLRPHPAIPPEPLAAVIERFPGADVTIDKASDILELLRSSDLCIGSSSTATFQTALAGTPVVVLNACGFEWWWPLDGSSGVAVAHSEEELARWIATWADGEVLPGREELLDALGAGPGDAVGRALELLTRTRPTPAEVSRGGLESREPSALA
ncbi:MAG: hypothetical protein ACJ77M_17090 [Thermoleophilaceae bacterium]